MAGLVSMQGLYDRVSLSKVCMAGLVSRICMTGLVCKVCVAGLVSMVCHGFGFGFGFGNSRNSTPFLSRG